MGLIDDTAVLDFWAMGFVVDVSMKEICPGADIECVHIKERPAYSVRRIDRVYFGNSGYHGIIIW